MPQDELFWNPYRLVPIRSRCNRSKPRSNEKLSGHSGIIKCELENLTSLFIGAGTGSKNNMTTSIKQPLLRDGKRVIPGTSLKGMFRALAELVGGGCFVVNDRHSRVPHVFNTCNKQNNLCITCRMFGMMERGRNAKVHIGQVSFGDAIVREERINTKDLDIYLDGQGTRHKPFYENPQSGSYDGACRKLYFHQPSHKTTTPPLNEYVRARAWTVPALLPGHHFDFEVQFQNLTDDELALLLYVINLEEHVEVTIPLEDHERDERGGDLHLSGPMRHKIGNAKPLGLGSCHIKITKLTYLAGPETRYTTLASGRDKILEGTALSDEIAGKIAPYVSDTSITMQSLRKMMVWDESDPRDFEYPDYGWFNTPPNKSKRLKKI